MSELSKTRQKTPYSAQTVQAIQGQAIAARFGRATLLDRNRHKDIHLNRHTGFKFAEQELAVPLVVTEFAAAARDLPIVFAGSDRMPLGVLGIRQNQNLFVDAEGNWQPGRYIPAHLRRYPFIFHEDEGAQQFALCIDEGAEHFNLGADAGEPLFIEDKPAPLVNEMLDFLGDIQRGFKLTQAYVEALRQEDLLIERNAMVELKSGENAKLDGFYIIDEKKFNELSPKSFNTWRENGWLALTYFHLQSQLNWTHLVELAAKQRTHQN